MLQQLRQPLATFGLGCLVPLGASFTPSPGVSGVAGVTRTHTITLNDHGLKQSAPASQCDRSCDAWCSMLGKGASSVGWEQRKVEAPRHKTLTHAHDTPKFKVAAAMTDNTGLPLPLLQRLLQCCCSTTRPCLETVPAAATRPSPPTTWGGWQAAVVSLSASWLSTWQPSDLPSVA